MTTNTATAADRLADLEMAVRDIEEHLNPPVGSPRHTRLTVEAAQVAADASRDTDLIAKLDAGVDRIRRTIAGIRDRCLTTPTVATA